MKWKQILSMSIILAILASGSAGCDYISPPPTTKAPSAGNSVISSQQDTGIWVRGEGAVTVIPDIAILSLGVDAQADTVSEAQNQSATAMTAIAAELDNQGINKKDINTQQFRISAVRRWVEDKEILAGYRVTNTITVKVRNTDDTSAIIDAVAGAGGDSARVNSVNFTVDDPSAYYEEAREKAMKDAEEKARQLADTGGVKLGTPIYINETNSYSPVSNDFYKSEGAGGASTPVFAGETEIRLSVQVVYSIR